MVGTRIEVQKVADAIAADRATHRETSAPMYANLSQPGYALPMAWRCAVAMSNELVDSIPRYSSADHGTLLKSLLAVVSRVLAAAQTEFAGPHFDAALAHDEAIQSCLEGEYNQLSQLNLEICLRKDYWRLSYDSDDDSFRLSLAPPQRRSALALLDHKVEFLGHSPEVREILSGSPSPNKAIPLILATGMNEVAFLRDAVPHAWRRLSDRIGFSIDEVAEFQAFVGALLELGLLWFRPDDLLGMFVEFVEEHKLAAIPTDQFHRLLDFFSAPAKEIESWGIAVPFVRFGDWLAYWPFVHHVLPPSLTFLSLLMRKHSDDWNNTVGSQLAEVAEAVRTRLPDASGLLFVTTKTKAGIGDIDLGIYDPRSRVLLLCEIKTVFDRFRTPYQFSNFAGQRVNFAKAAAQLAASMDAIVSGTWPLSDIFGRKLDGPPARILPLVLTWYDQHNPWLDDEGADLASCNFRVFQHLFSQAGGDIVMVHEAITQLSRIYCVTSLEPWQQLPIAGKIVAVNREVQTDLLPPEKALRKMPLSELVRQEIGPLAKVPTDWVAQLTAKGVSPHDFYFYGFDES